MVKGRKSDGLGLGAADGAGVATCFVVFNARFYFFFLATKFAFAEKSYATQIAKSIGVKKKCKIWDYYNNRSLLQ